MQVFKYLVPAGIVAPVVTQQVHEGHEWVYVIRGRLRLVLGDQDFVLPAGGACADCGRGRSQRALRPMSCQQNSAESRTIAQPARMSSVQWLAVPTTTTAVMRA